MPAPRRRLPSMAPCQAVSGDRGGLFHVPGYGARGRSRRPWNRPTGVSVFVAGRIGFHMPRDADRYRKRAGDCLAQAALMTGWDAKRQMIEIAATYGSVSV